MRKTFMSLPALALLAVASAVLLLNPAMAIDLLNKGEARTAASREPVRDKWAVLVAVGDFQDPTIPKLRFSTRNASDLAAILRDPNVGRFASDHVTVVSGEKATKSAIETALTGEGIARKALPNDLIVVYFCGRTLPSAGGREAYFLAYDTLASELQHSGLPIGQTLREIRRRTQCRRILAVLDSSPAVRQPGPYPALKELSAQAGVSVLASDELANTSHEWAAGGQSLFTHYLIEGLKPGAGLLALPVVAEYLGQIVPNEAQKYAGKTQTPALVLAADAPEMAATALGLAVKSAVPPAKVSIGHRVDDLQMRRPDLSRPKAPPPEADDGEDEDEDEAGGQVDFGAWMAKMKAAVQKRWQPPKGFESRRVVAVFTILRDGTIVNPYIVDSSGVEAVDKSALDALKAASPLEALPLGAPKSVQIRYQFDWKVNRN